MQSIPSVVFIILSTLPSLLYSEKDQTGLKGLYCCFTASLKETFSLFLLYWLTINFSMFTKQKIISFKSQSQIKFYDGSILHLVSKKYKDQEKIIFLLKVLSDFQKCSTDRNHSSPETNLRIHGSTSQ